MTSAPGWQTRHAAVLALSMVTASHLLVDTVAATLNPLWPTLERHLSLAAGQGFWLYLAWTGATSVCQFVFGVWGDRISGGKLMWFGPLIAILCLSTIGWTHSPWLLALMISIGGLGVAAYHPEAAALAGSSTPGQRSRAMSIFATGGFLGQSIAPYYSGAIVERYGLTGLSGGLVWGLAGLGTLFLLARWISTSGASDATDASAADASSASASSGSAAVTASGAATSSIAPPLNSRPTTSLAAVFAGRSRAVSLLLAVATLRIIAAAGLPLAVAYSLEARRATADAIGWVQSLFMLGIGVGGLVCAAVVRPRHERSVLWLGPLALIPPLVAIPYVEGAALQVCVLTCGLIVGFAQPVLISYGQQLMPDCQRVASALTMGVSWGLGGAIVAGAMSLLVRWQRTDQAFLAFAAAGVASSVLCVWLPRHRTEPSA